MDRNGYPDKDEISRIEDWVGNYVGLLRFVKSLWRHPDYFAEDEDRPKCADGGSVWAVSTGGWSGNEMLIEALETNKIFWNTCWYSSKRGGHYIFHIPEMLCYDKKD